MCDGIAAARLIWKFQIPDMNEIPHITLLEFDSRFAVFQEFVHYDFEQPLALPGI